MPKQIISFSLFGPIEKYNVGAVENLRLAGQLYPGWTVRYYCDVEATVVDQLASMGAEIVSFVRPHRLATARCMAWRFLAAADPEASVVIFRDCDSRLGPRERAAVDAWLASGKAAHVMHDHPQHVFFPMLSGMWGVRGGVLPDLPQWMADREQWGPCSVANTVSYSFDDQNFLKDRVWPVICDDTLHHTSVATPWGGEPFPAHVACSGFVGQQMEVI